MAKIEGFKIKNFRTLKDVTLGKLWNLQKATPLTTMTAVIGKNGVGKSSLFDAFGFLADCLKNGVEEACDARGRGGFDKIRSQGESGPIEFEVYYKEEGNARPITYELAIDLDDSGRPYVQRERLRQRRYLQRHGWPFSFLFLNEGKGVVWKGEAEGRQIVEDKTLVDLLGLIESLKSPEHAEESAETEVVELEDKRKLGIATLGALKQHPRISAFRRFIEGWYLSYFYPDAAREIPKAGPQKHLNIHGDNLGNVVQFMERDQKARLARILQNIANKIPGIGNITTHKEKISNNLYLLFQDKGFAAPFTQMQMSDGLPTCFLWRILRLRHSFASKSLKTACITSCSKLLPENSAPTQPVEKAVPRYLSLPINLILSMPWSRKRSGFWKKARTAFQPFVGQAMTRPSRIWWPRACRWVASGTAIISTRGEMDAL